jgi:hypothetical protein
MGSSSGTDVPLKEYIEALRVADARFFSERDRRYTERDDLRAQALKIKEEADKEALRLQRENQTYKDEKANALREQIGSERGLYATKDDIANAASKTETMVKPLTEYVFGNRGKDEGVSAMTKALYTTIGLLIAVGGLYYNSHRTVPTPVAPTPIIVTVPTSKAP